jgi:tRNA (cytidine/uridine-2'-O-)-methyltransferase
MNQIVLYEPEIPPNTGNVARTCAATSTALALIEPLGFSLDDRYLKRAGLDYWQDVQLKTWANWEAFRSNETSDNETTLALLSTRGNRCYTEIPPDKPVTIVFGPETRGLPRSLLASHPDESYRIPMIPGLRSLNLSNTVALVLYDILRRQGFPGMQ